MIKKLFLICFICLFLVGGCASNRRLIIPTPPEPYNIDKIENEKELVEGFHGFAYFSKKMMYLYNTIYRIEYGSNYYFIITNENGIRQWQTPNYYKENKK